MPTALVVRDSQRCGVHDIKCYMWQSAVSTVFSCSGWHGGRAAAASRFLVNVGPSTSPCAGLHLELMYRPARKATAHSEQPLLQQTSPVICLPAARRLLQNAANSVLGQELIAYAKHLGIKTINVVRRREAVNELKQKGCAPTACHRLPS